MDNKTLFIIAIIVFVYFATKKEDTSLERFQIQTEDQDRGPATDNVYYCQSLCSDQRRGTEWWWKNYNKSFADCYLDCMKNKQ
jgi:hypothetical protein